MNDLQAFPLRATSSVKHVDQGACETCIQFEKDEQKGLPYRLAVLLRVELLDENSGKPIFRAKAAATMANHEVLNAQMPVPSSIQAGELELLLDSPSLEAAFLCALDDAYTRIEKGAVPGPGEVVGLAVKGGVT